jgi:hypothetical protein
LYYINLFIVQFVRLNYQHQNNVPAAPKEGIFMNHVHVHSRPSTSASINQGINFNILI